MLVVQRFFRAKRTNLHEKYDYPMTQSSLLSAAELTFELERALEIALQLFRMGSGAQLLATA